jgi:hypothetical protein
MPHCPFCRQPTAKKDVLTIERKVKKALGEDAKEDDDTELAKYGSKIKAIILRLRALKATREKAIMFVQW